MENNEIMTEFEIKLKIKEIESMDRLSIASLLRFAESTHPLIQNPELFKKLKERFDLLGGWDSQISKIIGWNR